MRGFEIDLIEIFLFGGTILRPSKILIQTTFFDKLQHLLYCFFKIVLFICLVFLKSNICVDFESIIIFD
jgi:hypothetical protein